MYLIFWSYAESKRINFNHLIPIEIKKIKIDNAVIIIIFSRSFLRVYLKKYFIVSTL